MTGCLALLPVVIGVLVTDDSPEAMNFPEWMEVAAWVVIGVVSIQLLTDGRTLWRRGLQTQTVVPEVATAEAAELADKREKLLIEMRRRVDKRLAYVYGGQPAELLNVAMLPDPEQVGDWAGYAAGQGTVYLNHQPVPQPGRRLETFADDRWTTVASEKTVLDTFLSPAIDGRLLILGAPGSGKTTALLKLADDLLTQAEVTGKIPYIFELSAWREDEQDIASWLRSQLEQAHKIAQAVSRQWILDGDLLPLLDGLDELAPKRQPLCIERINEFVNTLGRQVVVCCRNRAYEAAQKASSQASRQRLQSLNGALRLQPLTERQIRDYFERLGRTDILQALKDEDGLGKLLQPSVVETSSLEPLGSELDSELDSELEPALLKIPLFLQMLAVAYQPQKTITSKPDLFDAYIARRLETRVRQWDRTQARQQDLEIEFAYETVDVEPSAETTKHYLGWLAYQLRTNSVPNVFLIEKMQPHWLEKTREKWQYCLLVGLIWGLIGSLVGSLISSLILGLVVSLIWGLIVGLIWGLVGSLNEIRTVEILKFSSRFAKRDFFKQLASGLILGLILSSILSLISGLTYGLTWGLVLGPVWGLILGLIAGFKEDFETREKPNQGVIASAKNISVIAAASYLLGVLVQFFLLTLATPSGGHFSGGIWTASLIGGTGWAIVFSLEAGQPVIKHSILRFFLQRQGHIPRNYTQFLRYTTERRLTQQVGGSFRFIHRELLDHFADTKLEPESRRS